MRRHVDAAVPHRAGYGDVAGRVLYINSQCARIFGASPTLTCANVLAWLFEVPEARAIMLEWAQESAWLWPGCEA
jgi:PAS domain-containing protein